VLSEEVGRSAFAPLGQFHHHGIVTETDKKTILRKEIIIDMITSNDIEPEHSMSDKEVIPIACNGEVVEKFHKEHIGAHHTARGLQRVIELRWHSRNEKPPISHNIIRKYNCIKITVCQECTRGGCGPSR